MLILVQCSAVQCSAVPCGAELATAHPARIGHVDVGWSVQVIAESCTQRSSESGAFDAMLPAMLPWRGRGVYGAEISDRRRAWDSSSPGVRENPAIVAALLLTLIVVLLEVGRRVLVDVEPTQEGLD